MCPAIFRGCGWSCGLFAVRKEDQQFFFEKKSQKTFAHGVYTAGQRVRRENKSFLVLFFKKELLPFFPSDQKGPA